MGRIRSVISSSARKMLAVTPDSFSRSLEAAGRLGQGKGGGATTVAQEVAAALSLLPLPRRASPVVFDIGANVGEWTAALLSIAPQAHVTCFEPSQAAFDRLNKRFIQEKDVKVLQLGVGKLTEKRLLWADQPGSGLASLTRRRLDHFDLAFSHSEMVEVVALDDWCFQNSHSPDVIKLDIEGHELDALAGASNAVSKAFVVQFEFGGCNIDTRTYFQDFFYYFKKAEFILFRLSPRGLTPIPNYRELDEAFVTTNFYAARRKIS